MKLDVPVELSPERSERGFMTLSKSRTSEVKHAAIRWTNCPRRVATWNSETILNMCNNRIVFY